MVLTVGCSNTPGQVLAAVLLRGHRTSLRVPPTLRDPRLHGEQILRTGPGCASSVPASSAAVSGSQLQLIGRRNHLSHGWSVSVLDLLWPRCSGRDAEATDATRSESVILSSSVVKWWDSEGRSHIQRWIRWSVDGLEGPDCSSCSRSTCDPRGKFYTTAIIPRARRCHRIAMETEVKANSAVKAPVSAHRWISWFRNVLIQKSFHNESFKVFWWLRLLCFIALFLDYYTLSLKMLQERWQ